MRPRLAASALALALGMSGPTQAGEVTFTRLAVFAIAPTNQWEQALWDEYSGAFRSSFFVGGCSVDDLGVLDASAKWHLRKVVLTTLSDPSVDKPVDDGDDPEDILRTLGVFYGSKACRARGTQ